MGTHMKTTLDLSDPLFRAAKSLAAQQHTTLRALVEEGLRLVIAQRAHSPAKPYELPDLSVAGKLVAPYDLQQLNDQHAAERFLRVSATLQQELATRSLPNQSASKI